MSEKKDIIISKNPEVFLKKKIDDLHNSEEPSLISTFFELFASLYFDKNDSVKYWKSIESHRNKLRSILERDVGLQVTLLDYFSNIENRLKNPKIVEMELFEEILKASKEDPKTSLYNMRYFKNLLNNELNRAKRNNFPVSLIFFDLDNFKNFNDTIGHQEGDHLLHYIAKSIKKIFRKEDVAARFGGDEFIVLLPHINKTKANLAAKRLLKEFNDNPYILKNIKNIKNSKYTVSASIGIATYPIDAVVDEDLIEKADLALFKAKKEGKNKAVLYS